MAGITGRLPGATPVQATQTQTRAAQADPTDAFGAGATFDDGFDTGDVSRFKAFLGEADSAKDLKPGEEPESEGAKWVTNFDGSKEDIARNVATAKKDLDEWLAQNPNASKEQLQQKMDEIKSRLGSRILSDKAWTGMLFSNLLSAIKRG